MLDHLARELSDPQSGLYPGFDFVDANEIFDGVTFTYEDDRISYGEHGLVTLGSLRGTVVSIVHTEQGDHIRVISIT